MPARRDNWPNLLAQFIEQRREQPFAWAVNDCCIFAADWVAVCTGTDHAQPWRGRYSSGLGAVRFLDEAGGVVGGGVDRGAIDGCGHRNVDRRRKP